MAAELATLGSRLRTRIAPTPSGYLHLGNAWSFLYTWLLARKQGGTVHLRIDDLDAERFREAYVEDIFASLGWLGLNWDGGPASPADFFSQRRIGETAARHAAALASLVAVSARPTHGETSSQPYLFTCSCSRESLRRASEAAGARMGAFGSLYPGTCRAKRVRSLAEVAPGMALRLHVPEDIRVVVHDLLRGVLTLCPGDEVGDVVVRTRAGGVAYHLASVADDEALQMNCIVRGEDLLPSTGVQLALAQVLGASHFQAAHFVHHPLMTQAGAKLSKSEGAPSLKALRAGGVSVAAVYRYFAKTLGLAEAAGQSLASLLEHFPPERAAVPVRPLVFEELLS